MKLVFRLAIVFLILLISSAPPAAAAINTSEFQPSFASNAPTFQPDLANPQPLIFLPSVFKVFIPSCQEIPGQIQGLFGSSLVVYYPLWELDGNTVIDLSPNNHSGIYEGRPTLNAVPALCGSAPRFDGIDDIANIYSSSLSSAFNGDEGTLILQLKIENDQWTDGRTAYYLSLRANDDNQITLFKSANHQLDFAYTSGGARLSSTLENIATSHWVTYAITWSTSKDRFTSYVAGENIFYPYRTGLISWMGNLTSAQIAGQMNNPANFAKGSISSVVLLDKEATADEVREYSSIFGARKVLTVLGDSISWLRTTTPWSMQVIFEYDGGNKITLKSHARSSQTIMDNMDEQTAAAASDNADIIIIQLGTVDDNNGDMAALQSKVEQNIAELKLSNPHATLYYMNVLPRWTSDGSEVDKSNIRAAIAAACASQGITCWDTYSIPWITPADTSDGVHPTAAGQAKIANQVLQRIQSTANEEITNVP